MVQAKLLIQAGQPVATVTSALTGVGLITTAVLLLLPVLTVPALLIGPPPAHQLQLGLLVSLLLAVVIVGVGVTALTWPGVVAAVGRLVGHVLHRVRPSVTAGSVASVLRRSGRGWLLPLLVDGGWRCSRPPGTGCWTMRPWSRR